MTVSRDTLAALEEVALSFVPNGFQEGVALPYLPLFAKSQGWVWVHDLEVGPPRSVQAFVLLTYVRQDDKSLWVEVVYWVLVQRAIPGVGWSVDYKSVVKVAGDRLSPLIEIPENRTAASELWVESEVRMAAHQALKVLKEKEQRVA